MKTSFAIGFGALRSNPMRTTLSTLGVIIGVASLVAILSVTEGLESFSREQIEKTTDLQTVLVTPRMTDVVNGVHIRRDKKVMLTARDVAGMQAAVGDKALITLTYTGSCWLTLPGDTVRVPAIVTAILPNALPLLEGAITEGRFLSDEDIRSSSSVAVLASETAERLFPGDSVVPRVDRTFVACDREFRVVGVSTVGREPNVPRVFVPFTRDMTVLLGRGSEKPTVAVAKVWDIEEGKEVRERIEAWLDSTYGDHTRDFVVASRQERVEQVAQAMFVFKLAMGAITGISLLVGGIGIMNILLASVSERTREIGIRRAAGARAREIMLQFLAESLAISGLGSLIGIAVGYAGSVLITAIIRGLTGAPFYTSFTWVGVGVAVGAACLVGIVFGLYPARVASRLSPSEAIRHE